MTGGVEGCCGLVLLLSGFFFKLPDLQKAYTCLILAWCTVQDASPWTSVKKLPTILLFPLLVAQNSHDPGNGRLPGEETWGRQRAMHVTPHVGLPGQCTAFGVENTASGT